MNMGVQARRFASDLELRWVARGVKRNFIVLSQEQEQELATSVIDHYYIAKGKGDPRAQPGLFDDFEDSIYGTVNCNRATVIPWLNAVRPLAGLRILEVGTGTGGSIVPLAEQGAHIVGIDVDEESLSVARDRLRIYGLADRTELHLVNAADLKAAFSDKKFDLVIFFASLEHMTTAERRKALPAAWNLLDSGGQLAIIETPNRLWWYDGHTSELPFYNWLPDDVAYHYRIYSQRSELKELALGEDGDLLPLTRMGRGASYQEFQIALPELDLSRVDLSMRSWLRLHNPMRLGHWHASGNAAYARLLHRVCPGIAPAFFEPYLDFVVTRKS